jgi:Fibronectin type III domain
MKKRPFLLLLATFLLGICCFHYSCKPKKPCCDLEAPTSLTATNIDSTSSTLEWTPVSGAAAYQISVKDVTSNTTLPQLTTFGTDTLLTGLTPNHEYTAIVQAICGAEKTCRVSPNVVATCFTKGVIVEDVVIMRDYNNSLEGYCQVYNSADLNISNNNIPLDFKGNSGVIYQFEITYQSGSPKYYFKLAYDSTCVNSIRAFICPQSNASLVKATISNNVLQFKVNSTTLLVTLTAKSTGIDVAINNNSCSIKYREILGTEPWVGNCPTQ